MIAFYLFDGCEQVEMEVKTMECTLEVDVSRHYLVAIAYLSVKQDNIFKPQDSVLFPRLMILWHQIIIFIPEDNMLFQQLGSKLCRKTSLWLVKFYLFTFHKASQVRPAETRPP